ncbi:U3 small nucleolar RNA-associated protein 23 [Nematocida minor]|uniref:U3 small nucleolar RNA-associated protein 23 n=1 Tax=Nematocida minor TaxID=1912983 RepID=UPI002220B54F|nr:U3 small nucleolar RNA-associated protein 23 [Nematocida minor]KAI5190842.1 U3 small nucleolar RNA-associated protein 23 [Nematocida minor]
MKTARLKQIRKLVKSLEKVGYRAPFNILADHNFLSTYNNSQMSLDVLEKLLNGKIRICTTLCEYKRYTELVKDKKLIGYVALKKCTHKDEFRTRECLTEMVGENNPHHYFLGISPKHKQIKEELKIPIIFMRSGVLCLEIGDISAKEIEKKTESTGLSDKERKRLDELFNE